MAKIIPIRDDEFDPFLPAVFRVESLRYVPTDDWNYGYEATIFHDPHSYEVYWETTQSEEISIGSLVSHRTARIVAGSKSHDENSKAGGSHVA